jgi:hypothetical protein
MWAIRRLEETAMKSTERVGARWKQSVLGDYGEHLATLGKRK